MCCANFALKHSRKDQNGSNRLYEFEMSQRLVCQEKNGKPESKQGIQDYALISLISRGSLVQSGAPPPYQPLVDPPTLYRFIVIDVGG
jgi:hypothetical protein